MKIILSFILLTAACAPSMERRLDIVRADFKSDTYAGQSVGDKNLDPLMSGKALFQQNRFNDADQKFEDINRRMSDAQNTGAVSEIGKAAMGEMSSDYKPYFMDDLFISYYQIWAALADDRSDDARVIINQSYDKQRRLSLEYASLLKLREDDKGGIGKKLRNENSVQIKDLN